jgi:hypothetical protein
MFSFTNISGIIVHNSWQCELFISFRAIVYCFVFRTLKAVLASVIPITPYLVCSKSGLADPGSCLKSGPFVSHYSPAAVLPCSTI